MTIEYLLRWRTGSPPQVRGKPYGGCIKAARAGITPAGAGKTHPDKQRLNLIEDHPRRCGENRFERGQNPRRRGSPPQVRGKPLKFQRACTMTRITPAGAGKTSQINRTVMLSWDHPRRCGENVYNDFLRQDDEGSPPQVRGKL